MIVFTRHALERMKQRGITQKEVEEALLDTSASEPANDSETIVAQSLLCGRILRVHFRIVDGDRLVVTAYWTSKVRKYKR